MTSHHSKKQDDDIQIEDVQPESSSFRKTPESKLKEEISAAKKQSQEYLEGWQRAKADLINFKKEAEETRKKSAKFAAEDIIAQCIPVLDSFDMAFKNKEAWEQAPENWRRGIEYIHTQLLSVLRANGVEAVTPKGEHFNPSHHDSAGTVSVDTKAQEGIILDVVQTGYRMHDKLIRAPKVIVGHYHE